MDSSPLPSNNISQKLFYQLTPQCTGDQPSPCCTRDMALQSFYKKAPNNIWNTATNYQGGPGFNQCTDDAYFKQSMLSQYYRYLSKNNSLK